MATSTPCIICSRLIRRNNSHKPNTPNKEVELLQRFIKLLGGYLDNHDVSDEDDSTARIKFENFIDAELVSCKECSKVVESFCELYHQMKCVELRLNWKLRILIDLMSNPDKMPNAKNFENETGSPTEQGTTESFKSALVKKCARRLEATFPRIVVSKHKYLYLKQHNKLSDHHKTIPSNASDGVAVYDDTGDDDGDQDSRESENLPMVDSKDTISMSRLRIVHRCNTCLKTFSSMGKLNEHKLSHENEDLSDWSDYGDAPNCQLSNSKPGLAYDDQDGVNEKVVITLQKLQTPEHAPKRSSHSKTTNIPTSSTDPDIEADQKIQPSKNMNSHKRKNTEQTPPPVMVTIIPSSKSVDVGAQPSEKSSIDPITLNHKCSLCSSIFKTIYLFDRHYKSVHLGVRYRCSLCGEDFCDKATYVKHYNNIHLGIKFKCDTCSRLFNEKRRLKIHQKTRHLKEKPDLVLPRFPKNPETGRFHCTLCSRNYSKESACQEHYKCGHLNFKYNCSECGLEFPRREDLLRHRKSIHIMRVRFECPKCKKSFLWKRQLKWHQRRTSCGTGLGLKPIPKEVCHLCGKEFACRSTLRNHVKQVHVAKRKYQCELCGKKFKTPSHVTIHQNGVHLGMKLNKSKKKGNSDS